VTLHADDRARLERERDFLLRSLDDLERELDKGAIDDESYERLHADYTARAAAVIRALSEATAEQPAAPPTSLLRRGLTIAGIGAFLAVVAVVLAAALTDRLPGQTSSGNRDAGAPATPGRSGGVTVEERRERLEETVARNPDDLASRLLLARYLEADGDLAGALAQYDQVLARNPQSAESEAHAGRILYLTAQAAVRSNPDVVDELVRQSMARLDRAVEIGPAYPDARYFRAIVAANEYGDFVRAQGDLQRYLVLAPEGPFSEPARQLLAQVTSALEGTPIQTPTTTTTTRNTKK